MVKTTKYCVISFGALLLLWQVFVTAADISPALFPPPTKVVAAFGELLKHGLKGSSSDVPLMGHIGISMARFLTGYILAVVTAILAGLIFGCLPRVFAYVNPVIQLIRPIAPVAWMPFIVLWFGIGDIPAIVIIFIAGFFPVLLSTVSAVQNVDPTYKKVAQNFGLSKIETVRKIIFPAAFTQIIHSLRLALGTSWIFLVSGEMVGAQSGLGFLVMDAKNCMRPDALLAVMITIGMIGFLLDTCIRLLEGMVKCI
ncbi:MAG: ABC transporter permease [Lachnospiraceae bacterium]|nr:ABC transporter permease [Lachnospiraceae bacterium]